MLRKPKKFIHSLPLELRCERVILHFDYDCFYASVFEAENPRLKYLPLAVQQKHIIVTCNYEARRRGLYKLQLISDARRICPEVIIVLGEDLTKFRDVSKDLARFLASHVWSGKCERLGFDETWLDCTSMIDYNVNLLTGDPSKSFFHLSQEDSTVGFAYDAGVISGYIYPEAEVDESFDSSVRSTGKDIDPMELRLRLGSHLAAYLRTRLEEKGFTATVGISVNKVLSKLVGNKHKPNAQTTLMPPYNLEYGIGSSSVTRFLDDLEIGKIPGIGFKISHKLRELVLGRESNFHGGFAPDNSGDGILVRDIRLNPDLTAENLQKILGGHGWSKDIGQKVHELVNGVDDSEVAQVKLVPTQISIEDSYLVLDNMDDLRSELTKLAISLIKRMRVDLVEESSSEPYGNEIPAEASHHRMEWLATPKTLRLSTRPRPPRNADGTRSRAFQRISRSGPFPTFMLSITTTPEDLAARFVDQILMNMFKKLHPDGTDWDLSLVNIAVTNMSTMAGDGKNAQGRDISKMLQFHNQQKLQTDIDAATENSLKENANEVLKPADFPFRASEDSIESSSQKSFVDRTEEWSTSLVWEASKSQASGEQGGAEHCRICGASMPAFALEAHLRFHLLPD